MTSTFLNKTPRIVYNGTDSIPIGLYWISQNKIYSRNDLVIFKPDNEIKKIVLERNWLPENGYLMKPIAAIEGDKVCTDNAILTINQNTWGEVQTKDAMNRALPQIKFCRLLKKNEVFMAIKGKSNSFDSRYFGAIKTNQIEGKATPLWIF